ncbi:MAG TPA: prephenate dehydrogenase [Candidatus Egerieenecus merdigallinarum]|nr:prephenate dehydrogenase [Candidatus Egerieenecus merdigallinarum]
MTVGIVGLGLIGGSLARSIKVHTDFEVLGMDINPQTMLQANLLGAIDGTLTEDNLARCDVVLVALYPAAIVTWITEHQDAFRPGAWVIDCGGVKEAVCTPLNALAQGKPWHYCGGHPMAGREFSGFRYAKDDLFDRASMILTPPRDAGPEVRTWLKDFFLTIGFRRVQFTTPREHDEMIAYTSQLAHVVSSAYVKCPLAQKHRGFSAGSFADMTRVAKLNEDMWTELFFDNRDALLPEINGLIDRLAAYRDALAAEDHQAMKQLLREGREIKEALEE